MACIPKKTRPTDIFSGLGYNKNVELSIGFLKTKSLL
jgi:hypothetical protein